MVLIEGKLHLINQSAVDYIHLQTEMSLPITSCLAPVIDLLVELISSHEFLKLVIS